MSYNVAVVGATGNVGREMLNILDEREFPVDQVFAIASRQIRWAWKFRLATKTSNARTLLHSTFRNATSRFVRGRGCLKGMGAENRGNRLRRHR